MGKMLFQIVEINVINFTQVAYVTIEDVTNINSDEISNLEVRGEVIGSAIVKKHEMNQFGNADFGNTIH